MAGPANGADNGSDFRRKRFLGLKPCAARQGRVEKPTMVPVHLHHLAVSRGCARLGALLSVLLLVGCVQGESETLRFAAGPADIEVTFHGEVADAALFGPGVSLLDHVHPVDERGRSRGSVFASTPGWLHFESRVDGRQRELLVAKRPLMNQVSWDDIARAGASLGNDSELAIGLGRFAQDARVTDAQGNEYRVRLPTCGDSSLANLSEWNLLIGAVHRGDMDFAGDRYAWVSRPYRDKDLKVGYAGSLSWCRNRWQGLPVVRGYFFVSRFHAAAPELRTNRLYWRPVLERVTPEPEAVPMVLEGDIYAPITWSPSLRVGFAGRVSHEDLFGSAGGLHERIPVQGGDLLDDGRPDWLRFQHEGKTLLVAARPVLHSVSWDAIAKAGAVAGDGASLRLGWRRYRQDAAVEDRDGNRYRVRLLTCGQSTLDLRSEWNLLIGGIHRGDEDFRAYPDGVYGWLHTPFEDEDLNLASGLGSTTWCQERIRIKRKAHGVNRGYFTVSRFHATETDFTGSAFAWRPVLEAVH